MEVSKEVRVKKEPIYNSQSISQTREATMRSNYDQSIKQERQLIDISDRKRTRESSSNYQQPNKRIKQSMKVKEEPIDNEEIEVKAEEKFSNKRSTQIVSIAFLNQQTTTTDNNPIINTNQPRKSNNQPNNPRKRKSKYLIVYFCYYKEDNLKYSFIFRVPNNVKGSFKCPTCKEVFKSSNQLRKHQRIHTGERPNECDICYKSFDQPIELEMHKMIHFGKKPYKCDLCEKAFFESFRLESHRNSHFRERLFECDICQMRLFNSNDLESHRRIHSLENL